MKNQIKNINKISLPLAILLSSVVLVGFLYAIQVNKQKSIEKQQEIKLDIEIVKTETDPDEDYVCRDEENEEEKAKEEKIKLAEREVQEKNNMDEETKKRIEEEEKIRADAKAKAESDLREEQKKEELKIKTEQETLFKIEKCKSEYIINKGKKLDGITVELLKFSISAKKVEDLAIYECTQEGFAATGMDASTMSAQNFAGFMSMIRQQCENSISAQGEIEKFQNQKFTEMEEQLQIEYQKCLQR